MPPKVVFGNASEGASRGGWFMGHFFTPPDDPHSTRTVELKWAVHAAGDCRREWAMNVEATTVSILIQGRFCLQFPEQKVLLSCGGDYALWPPGVPHCWSAESDSTILTIRWPSTAGDSIVIPTPLNTGE